LPASQSNKSVDYLPPLSPSKCRRNDPFVNSNKSLSFGSEMKSCEKSLLNPQENGIREFDSLEFHIDYDKSEAKGGSISVSNNEVLAN
jgi:hypothetical protein